MINRNDIIDNSFGYGCKLLGFLMQTEEIQSSQN